MTVLLILSLICAVAGFIDCREDRIKGAVIGFFIVWGPTIIFAGLYALGIFVPVQYE